MNWLLIVEWLARGVLALLLFLSIWSIAVMLDRRKFFSQFSSSTTGLDGILSTQKLEEFFELLSKSGTMDSKVFSAEFLSQVQQQKLDSEQIERRLNSQVLKERLNWETGLPILGSLGAIAPFIGLLGTILGIIVAFGELASGKMDSLKIMYALAEALILTAVGLGVAIPAVVANNYFNRLISVQMRRIESLKDHLISLRKN